MVAPSSRAGNHDVLAGVAPVSHGGLVTPSEIAVVAQDATARPPVAADRRAMAWTASAAWFHDPLTRWGGDLRAFTTRLARQRVGDLADPSERLNGVETIRVFVAATKRRTDLFARPRVHGWVSGARFNATALSRSDRVHGARAHEARARGRARVAEAPDTEGRSREVPDDRRALTPKSTKAVAMSGSAPARSYTVRM